MKKKLLIISCLMLFYQAAVHSQDTAKMYPRIGEAIPPFELINIGNYPRTKMQSDDFKGRFVVIDFWNKNCVSCVQSFPKLNKVHELYQPKGLDLILVGTDEKGISEVFENFKKKLDLKFAYAYNMQFYKNSVPSGAPHLLWIDDKGIVKAITPGSDLTAKNIDAFLQGKDFSFTDHSHDYFATQKDKAYDQSSPFLMGGNNGAKDEYEARLSYRSLITENIPGTKQVGWDDRHIFHKKRPFTRQVDNRQIYEVSASLEEMYRFAFTGYVQWAYMDEVYKEVQPKIIFEIKDSSLFKKNTDKDSGIYWYSLVLPNKPITPQFLLECMQTDLRRFFGYEARLETRKFSYLKLIATDKAKKLSTKGGKPVSKSDYISYKGVNAPIEYFFGATLSKLNYWETNGEVPLIINETGINENVDIDVKINVTNWQDVQQVYKELGFLFVPAEKVFKVLVIKDAKN